MRILVVDDDPTFSSTLCSGLGDHGFEARSVTSAEEAVELLRAPRSSYDVVLLDVGLPARSGWDLLESLRRDRNGVPVIFVTAREAVDERVRGLRLGADDYIIKPFAFRELLARIEAVVRGRREVPLLPVADLVIDLRRRRVALAGRAVDLTARELDVLLALYEAQGRPVTREWLLREVWKLEKEPETNLVDALVGRLRRKLGSKAGALIETIVGSGYRLRRDDDGGRAAR